jgi:predicted membrane protein
MDRQDLTKSISGLIIIAIGAVLLLSSLKIISLGDLSLYWPVFVILAGVLIFINDIRSWAVAGFVTILGVLFQLRELEVVDVEPWAIIWPLIIIFVGASLLFSRSYAGKRVSKSERDDVTAIMAGTNVANHSKSFKQSNATAIMGGARLDLRKADFEKEALIEVFGFWGGVEIVVPENIVIRNQVNNIMAGTEDKTHQKTDKKSPVLTVTGTLIMAGVSIRNQPSD